MPPLQLLIKPSSGLCNLRCKYCFYEDVTDKREQKNYGFMTHETLECLVKKALFYAEVRCDFAFQGGEPTLIGLDFFKQVIELQKKYNKKNLVITNTIQTNGYQLGPEWARFLSENKILTGISIDGIKAAHDSFRINQKNEGTFSEIMKTIDLFKEYKVEFNVLTVVNSKTAPKIRRIYEFYKKNGFQYLQFIACLDPIGEEQGQSEYSLSPEVYGQFLIDLFDLWFLDLQKGEQPFIRTFENYISILMGYIPESCEQRGFCSIQHVVEADGSVYPCDFYVLDEYRLGNLMEDSFEEIGERGRNSGFIESSKGKPEECLKCRYLSLCRGGCRRHRSIGEEGLIGKNYFCESYRMFFDAALSRIKMIADRLSGR